MSEIILTADRTLMSNYHKEEFLGFGSSAPPFVIPEWLYKFLFFPSIRTINGSPKEAPYGLRKIESLLMNLGFDVLTMDPDHLKNHIKKAKILGVYTMDPFGWGPSSSTFARILNSGESYSLKYFRGIFENPIVKKEKDRGLKIIVGGPGAWQFKYRKEFLDEHGIDVVILGEGELITPVVIKELINGKNLPKFIGSDGMDKQSLEQSPNIDQIPEIKRASINGLIEIGRGCPRHCQFCSVTLRPLRWYPYEKIEKELKINAHSGLNASCFHAEDVLLYGSKSWMPKDEKILKLQKLGKKYCKNINWSHTSIAAIATSQELMERCSEILLDENQTYWGAEIGIETASSRLLNETMINKVKPFKLEEWYDTILTAAGIMTDNKLIPACTLIVGLPKEKDEDVIKTIELVEDLKDFTGLLVPLFFVPLGQLKEHDWFKLEDLNELQRELMIKCFKHGIVAVKKIMKLTFTGWKSVFHPFYLTFIKLIEHQATKNEIL